jgi:carboxyl-terminal processing protease
MNNEPSKKLPPHIKLGLRIAGIVIVIAAVFLGGVYVGYGNRSAFASKVTSIVRPSAVTETAPTSSTVDLSEFWKAWQLVSQNFAPGANAPQTTDQDHIYGAIQGMVASFGDPYTTFFPPSENNQFQAQISGSFSGIGIQIGEKDGLLTVIAPLKGTPAEAAGIKPGDVIMKIDSTNTSTINIDQAVSMIEGKDGTTVTLTLARQGTNTPIVLTITRQTINLPTVDTETRSDKGVFIIHLYTFSANSAELFNQAMNSYLASGYHNLLLDLRGNPGGYLDAAVQIGSDFIPPGETIVKEIGKDPKDVTVHTSTGPVLFPKGDKLVILADQGSASAAEILAGALSQDNIGTLVGQQTFGKGSVQQVIPLNDDTSLKVTIAHWYTPDGTSISAKGLTPSILIPVDPIAKTDTQLDKAVNLFATLPSR